MLEKTKAMNAPHLQQIWVQGVQYTIVLVNKKNRRYRKLTPAECFQFQGYENVNLPTNVADGQLYKQARIQLRYR